uniref:Phosphoseryl-tRNA kinase n=2 Tax=Erpetoichthys calabaricus TaxID=27687 RepID=A0A8C4SET7_ERPCA
MHPSAILCLLSGLPAAGKSTLARCLVSALRSRSWPCFVISYDDIILEEAFPSVNDETGSPDEKSSWKLHRQKVLLCLERFLQILNNTPHALYSPIEDDVIWMRFICCLKHKDGQSLSASNNSEILPDSLCMQFLRAPLVVLDDNFYYPSMRYEVFQLARKYCLGFCHVHLDCPLELCLRRNRHRATPLPDDVIIAMSNRIEPPNPNKNSWEKNSLAVTTMDFIKDKDINTIMALFENAMNNPLLPHEDDAGQKEADRICCASSLVHQTDRALRHVVSQAMKTAKDNQASSRNLRSLAEQLHKLKESLLDDLRHGHLRGRGFNLRSMDEVVIEATELFERETMNIVSSD